jgi:hypothetical protein
MSKTFFQVHISGEHNILSHYDGGYKPLKADNTCPYTGGIRQLHCILSGRHIFISRDVPQSAFSQFLT